MKTAGILILILILGAGALVLLQKEETPQEKDGKAEEFTITELTDEASVKLASTETFTAINKEITAPVGSVIKTTATGRALLEQENTIITTVDRNTELTVESYNENQSSITLHTGGLWSRIEKTLEKGEFYEIKTKNSVATVRGTSFGSFILGNQTIIIVTKGVVATYLRDSNDNTIEGSKVDVPAGKKAVIGNTITVKDITSEDKAQEWYLFNNKDEKSSGTPKATTPPKTTTQTETLVTPQTTPSLPSVTITGILPTTLTIENGVPTTITLKGTGFSKLRSLVIGKQSATDYKIVSDTQIQFSSDLLNLKSGKNEFDITLTGLDGTAASVHVIVDATITTTQTQTSTSPNSLR